MGATIAIGATLIVAVLGCIAFDISRDAIRASNARKDRERAWKAMKP